MPRRPQADPAADREGETADAPMPVIFAGHGSPENALGSNEYSLEWKKLGRELPRPSLILCISAHWVIHEGTAVTAMRTPRTIHDFYGFPDELYAVRYPASGSPEGAVLVRDAVRSTEVEGDYEWGLDHGTWSVLSHMYPEADIPVIQLSLNYHHPPGLHFRIGQDLRPLRHRGVLILGSGNLVHNLMMLRPGAGPYPWAEDFDLTVKMLVERGDYPALVSYPDLRNAGIAHPTPEHYLPLLYTLGAAGNDAPRFFSEKIFAGSVSMRGIVFGGQTG